MNRRGESTNTRTEPNRGRLRDCRARVASTVDPKRPAATARASRGPRSEARDTRARATRCAGGPEHRCSFRRFQWIGEKPPSRARSTRRSASWSLFQTFLDSRARGVRAAPAALAAALSRRRRTRSRRRARRHAPQVGARAAPPAGRADVAFPPSPFPPAPLAARDRGARPARDADGVRQRAGRARRGALVVGRLVAVRLRRPHARRRRDSRRRVRSRHGVGAGGAVGGVRARLRVPARDARLERAAIRSARLATRVPRRVGSRREL